ncbi:MAG: ribosome-recycling factor [Minisyncoccia bacterium]
MPQELLKKLEEKIKNIANNFYSDILTLRTSRPSPSLVENISVEAYGGIQPIKHLANISIIPPNVIIIEPWDKSLLANIKKAIETTNIGISPQLEANTLRLYLPPLTKERKEELIKILSAKKEDFRIKIRQAREEALEELKNLFEKKEISEDEKFKLKEEIQKIVDKGNEKLDDLELNKKKEIEEG